MSSCVYMQWKTCLVFSECELFLVSLRFAYGLALMKKGNRTVRAALPPVCTFYSSSLYSYVCMYVCLFSECMCVCFLNVCVFVSVCGCRMLRRLFTSSAS